MLITDRHHPGPQRHLTDTLAAEAPGPPTTSTTADTRHQATTTTVERLVQAHTGLITAHHDAEQAIAEQLERYRRKNAAATATAVAAATTATTSACNHARYLLPLERLWGTQSMVRLDRLVEPPLDRVTWSASISFCG